MRKPKKKQKPCKELQLLQKHLVINLVLALRALKHHKCPIDEIEAIVTDILAE